LQILLHRVRLFALHLEQAPFAGVSIEDFRGYSGPIVLLSVLAGSPHNSRIALSAIRDR
jgi:hypothetical protein